MISYEEAIRRISLRIPPVRAETVSLQRALNRRLHGDIVAQHPSPRFDNSAVDGFAVGSIGTGPWDVVGTVPAGTTWPRALASNESVRILTGAPVPRGTAALVMQEDAVLVGAQLSADSGKASNHLRRMGEEYQAGAVLVSDGTIITPAVLGAIAANGQDSVEVRTTPRVGILVTGSELVKPGGKLEEGQIFESNSVALRAWLTMMGYEVEVAHAVDDMATTGESVRCLLQSCDLLLTTGGVCHGEFDFVRQALQAASFETVFEGVAVKPGKPVAFGVHPDGKAWFGLPGNPMSSFVTFALFVSPWLGHGLEFHSMCMGHDFTRRPGREEFVPAQIRWGPGPQVWLAPTVGSHATSALVSAHGLARVPGDSECFQAGDKVQFAWLPWGNQS